MCFSLNSLMQNHYSPFDSVFNLAYDKGMKTSEFIDIYHHVCSLIEQVLIDRVYLQSEDWQALKKTTLEQLEQLEQAQNTDQSEHILQEMLSALPLSHCALLSPHDNMGQTLPQNALSPVAQMDQHYLYFKMPSLLPPNFHEQSFFDFLKPFRHDKRPLILDLRLNQGGALSSTGQVLGVLMGANHPFALSRKAQWKSHDLISMWPHASYENAHSEKDIAAIDKHPYLKWQTPEDPPFVYQGPVLVLLGSQTYSCGELMAHALKKRRLTHVIGAPSSGAVVGAREYDCTHGYRVCLPFVELLSAQGETLENKGVTVDDSYGFASSPATALNKGELETLIQWAKKKHLI